MNVPISMRHISVTITQEIFQLFKKDARSDNEGKRAMEKQCNGETRKRSGQLYRELIMGTTE